MNERVRLLPFFKKRSHKRSIYEIWNKFTEITKNIAFSIVTDLLPLDSSELKELNDVLKILEPFYRFPSRKQLLEVIFPKMYEEVRKIIIQTIKEDFQKGVNGFTLTIDGWNDRCITDYMTVTIHYWNEDFVRRQFLLQLESLPRKWNTAQDLFHLIQNVLLKYGLLQDKTIPIHIVTAQGNNIIKAVSINDNWIRIPCFARLLQHTVDDVLLSFTDFNGLVTKCLNVVSKLWSKTSVESNDSEISGIRKSCITDTAVPSWNSIFEVFDDLLKLQSTIESLSSGSDLEKLSETDWESMSSYVHVFSSLKQASDLFSKEEYPPLSLFLPTIRAALELLESSQLQNKLYSQLICSICSRFSCINTNESMIIAMVLDPRFKTRLLSEDENFTVFDVVKSKMLLMKSRSKVTSSENNMIRNNITNVSIESYFATIEKKDEAECSHEKLAEAELANYLCEKVVPISTLINEWWKNNSKRFPKLSELAKVYLSIPSVQVNTEKAFLRKKGFTADKRAEVLADQVSSLDLTRISFLSHNLNQFQNYMLL